MKKNIDVVFRYDYLFSGDVPSEVMSSSTISRAEESARLKDLEETFEERYTKVRCYISLQTKDRKRKENDMHESFLIHIK
jgi:hypothetical protein